MRTLRILRPDRLAPLGFLFLAGWNLGLAAPLFTDATPSSGVRFVHGHGGSGQKYFCETMGSGVVTADFDGDGHLDLYFVNGATLPGFPGPSGKFPNQMYRGRGDGTFEDVTATSGTAGRGYGMGASAADYDNDGDVDLFVTNFGPSVLFRNEGGGRFTDVTASAGVAGNRWGTSSAWADMDKDGDLDLFVANYVDFQLENNKFCGNVAEKIRSYCHPDVYPGISNSLFRNNGDGTFTDVTQAAGVENPTTKGLGVLWLDADQDGDLDLYVANDSTMNLLYGNRGDGTFEDLTLLSGAGYNENGATEAGMGVDAQDLNGDGFADLVVTNLDLEGITLYQSTGPATYLDIGFRSGLKAASLPFVGFGTLFLDADADGDSDLFVANGHIIDNIELFRPGSAHAQPVHLYRNDGTGRFHQLPAAEVLAPGTLRVGRGLAAGDFDEDGDLDLAINNNNGPAQILRNDGKQGHWLHLRLQGPKNSAGIGAKVTVTAGGRKQWDEMRTGASYCSQSELALHFGLGPATVAETIEIRWPSGEIQVLENVQANQRLVIRQAGSEPTPATETSTQKTPEVQPSPAAGEAGKP